MKETDRQTSEAQWNLYQESHTESKMSHLLSGDCEDKVQGGRELECELFYSATQNGIFALLF